jgi:drug/metabolite transporter (DMT)-like permease
MSKSRLIPILEAVVAVVIWGGTFIATKIALREVSPATIVWLRFAMGIPILGAAVMIRRQLVLPKRNEWGFLALLGFLSVTFHQWLQANGLLTAQATTTAWIVASTPIFIALLGWLILKEKLGWLRSFGIGLAAVGVLIIVSKGRFTELLAGTEGTLGDLLVFLSAVNWAVVSILSRRELARQPAARMMFYMMLMGWGFTNIWIFGFGPGITEIKLLTTNGWMAILMLGVLGSGLAYIAWYDALQALPASQLGVFLNIEPLVTATLAAFILSEAISFISILGGLIILTGVYLVNRSPTSEPEEPKISIS